MIATQTRIDPVPAHPRLSVVIPHLNQPDFLGRCLASLAAGARRPDEVIVVDNGSQVLPEALCAAHGARLLTEAEPGPGPARNRGIAAASQASARGGWLGCELAGDRVLLDGNAVTFMEAEIVLPAP